MSVPLLECSIPEVWDCVSMFASIVFGALEVLCKSCLKYCPHVENSKTKNFSCLSLFP